MFRIWAKTYKDARIMKSIVIEKPEKGKSRTAKVFEAIEDICHELDLAKPIWLDKNVKEFKNMDKTTFNQDNFIESIPFDFVRVEVIEEDVE